jgi:spermidine synthase
MRLVKHNEDYLIYVDREELMTSRAHESELELARLGCAHLLHRRHPRVVIGGLGMGYTLSETVKLLRREAEIVVAELMPVVVQWNRKYFGSLNGSPMDDPRVSVLHCDVREVILKNPGKLDALMLDVDNGPAALTQSGNNELYSPEGIRLCMKSLKPGGTLSIWSGSVEPSFEKRLRGEGLSFKLHPVPAYKGAKNRSRYVWVIARRGELQ